MLGANFFVGVNLLVQYLSHNLKGVCDLVERDQLQPGLDPAHGPTVEEQVTKSWVLGCMIPIPPDI